MDNIDIKILNLLKQNARMSASEIGEKINLSVSAVLERIKKLEKSGIIKQYTLILDPKLINKDVSAFISIGLDHPKYNESFIESVLDHKQIVECHYYGDSDFSEGGNRFYGLPWKSAQWYKKHPRRIQDQDPGSSFYC